MKIYFKFLIAFVSMSLYSHLAVGQATVSGTVADKRTTEPLQGVTIMRISGNKRTAIANTDKVGKFSIQMSPGETVIFTYVGYSEEKYKYTGRSATDISIFMNSKSTDLDEVVVVGYEEKKKELVTGATTKISGKVLQDVPVANFMELMQGRVAGLNIQNNNGTPGMMGTVAIRGVNSINVSGEGDNAYLTPTSPLYVIDGIPFDPNDQYQYGFEQGGPGLSPLSLIPVQDIESVEVLKDGQASSLYGSKGAYGVILITTKRGRSTVPIVSYSTGVHVNFPPGLLSVIGGKEERLMRINQVMKFDTSYNYALYLVNSTPYLADSLNAYYNNATDWQSYFYRATYNMDHNINFSGGTETFNYRVGGGFYEDKGIIKNTGFSRYNLGMNMGYRPNDKFDMSGRISIGMGKNSKGSGNALRQTGVADAGDASSLLPAPSLFTASNDALSALSIIDDNKSANVSSSVDISIALAPGLRASTAISYTYNTGTEDTYSPGLLDVSSYGKVYTYNKSSSSFYNRSGLNYNKDFKEHGFGVWAREEISTSQGSGTSITQNRTPNDFIQGPFGYDYTRSSNNTNFDNTYRSVGFSGGISYNYSRKYVIDFSVRTDAASTSGEDSRWTRGGSIGVRYNLGREKFFSLVDKWMDYASLRGSYGRNIVPSGNIFDAYGRYMLDEITYNNLPAISISSGSIPNNKLIPSISSQYNFGVDVGFFQGLFSFGFDTYYKQLDKQLREKNIANHNGFTSVKTNETSIVNYGFEFSLGARPFKGNSKFSWDIGANLSINYDVMAHLPDDVRQIISDSYGSINRLGANTFSNLLYHTRGIFATDEDVPVDPATGLRYRVGGNNTDAAYFKAGDPYWTDINGDYILDQYDIVIAGNSKERFTGGVSNSFRYGPFGLSFGISYLIRRDILNNINANRMTNYVDPVGNNPHSLLPIEQYDFWRSNGDVAIYPNPYDYTRANILQPFRGNQTLFQEDGSYIKINSISVSYNFDKKFINRLGISSMRLSSSVNNIYTFSFYKGRDPENVSPLGRDGGNGYPMRRGASLNLDVQF